MRDFLMPSLGADMDSGKLVEWRVKPGDRVAKGDIVAVVETQKAAMEIEIFESGTIAELVVEPGTSVAVGKVIARFAPDDESSVPAASAPANDSATLPQETPESVRENAPAQPAPPVPTGKGSIASPHLRMSPAARHRARELGVDPSTINGSGPHGAIVLRDIAAVARPSPPPAPAAAAPIPTAMTAVPTSPLRAAIGAAMSRSKREIPHYYLSHTLSMQKALDWLRDENQSRSVTERILPGVLLMKAAVKALWDVPELNGWWVDGQLMQSEAVHLGTAVALRSGGVIAPAIRDAEQMSVGELMAALQDLVKRTRTGGVRQSEMTCATITVTSLGDRGADVVYGVINPPQVAIVGFGTVAERPWIEDGKVVAQPLVNVTLAADHRASDGHRGGLYLAAVDRHLQAPEEL